MRSLAVHYPSKSRCHRITSVPGEDRDVAEQLLMFITSLPDKDSKTPAELRAMCQAKRKELMSKKGQSAVLKDCREETQPAAYVLCRAVDVVFTV